MSDQHVDGRLNLKYRLLGDGLPPQPINLQVPGWGGTGERRVDGSVPQPAHCVPFVEGATYGLELRYPFVTECCVTVRDGRVHFAGDFSSERREGTVWPPFQSTNPGHYSVASLVDLEVPEGLVLRVEPHPRFFTDNTGSVPAAVIGHVGTCWWPMFLFVTFKAPRRGEEHIFRYGEPYAQAIIVPERTKYRLIRMTDSESEVREKSAQGLLAERRRAPQHRWVSPDGLQFDDLYRRVRLRGRDGHARVDSIGTDNR